MTDNVYERRRYSAVLVTHPQLGKYADLNRVLGASASAGATVKLGKSGWRTVRFEYLSTTSLYSRSRVKPEARARDNGFAHDMYCAISPDLPGLGSPVMLVASPYVRLLARILKRVTKDLAPPGAQYVKVDMPAAYKGFSSHVPGLTATRVTLSMPGDGDDVEFVSLTGTNPLRSDLRAAVQEVGEPFALRVEASISGEPNSKVHIDRHGNLSWYLTTEDRMTHAYRTIEAFDGLRLLNFGRALPLDKKPDDSDE